MAAWSSRDKGKQMASLRMIASAIGAQSGGISAGSEAVEQMKRAIASSDCSNRTNIMEVFDRMAEDPDEEEQLGPLHDAAKAGKMDICKHLVENLGFDVDVRANDDLGKTPSTCAMSCGKVIVVRYLIAKRADLNKQDALGFTPLHYATKRGHNGIARLLLSRGANVDVESSEGAPLHVSAALGKFDIMEILLEHHADLDRASPDLYTPLAPPHAGSEAVEQMKRGIASSDCSNLANIMEVFDRMAEDPDEEEQLGPLHDAAKAGKMDICKHLVENLGFDVDVRANDGLGKTPLTCAVLCGKVIAVRYLFAKGADLNKQDAMGFTPLHYATKRGYNGIARLLLSRGANVDVESSEGTLLHVSAARGKFDIMEILLEHHTDPDRASPDLHAPLAKVLCATYEKTSPSACLKCMKLLVKVVMLDPSDATLYSNQSFCHLKIGGAKDALVDANASIGQPDWPKGYYSKGAALMSLKGQKSDKYSKNQLKSHGERLVKEDVDASKGCTKDRKARLNLHGGEAVKGKDYAGASKFYTEGFFRHILWVICFMAMCHTTNAEHIGCDYAKLAQSMGFCNTNTASAVCCITVLNIVERGSNKSCICAIVDNGVEVKKIINYYYICHGKYQAVEALIGDCKGLSSSPQLDKNSSGVSPPSASEIIKNSSSEKNYDDHKSHWQQGIIVLFIVLLSCILLVLVAWLLYLLIKKSTDTSCLPSVSDESRSPAGVSHPPSEQPPAEVSHPPSEQPSYKMLLVGALGWIMYIYIMVKQKFKNGNSQDSAADLSSWIQMTNTREADEE